MSTTHTSKQSTTTLDGLAVMVKQGFDDVSREISDLKQGQAHIGEKVGKVERRVGVLEIRMGGLENTVESIDMRIANTAYNFDVEENARRIARIENHLNLDA